MKKQTKTRKLNVLVACESSGVVRDAFQKLGHNAWSCDLLPSDSDSRMHVQDDVLALLRGERVLATDINGRTERGTFAKDHWDLMIAHPPCTYLCNSGVRWLVQRCVHPVSFKVTHDIERWNKMGKAARFFNDLWAASIRHIAIENPIMHKYARNRLGVWRYDQIVQPWQFGHGETKATCLWLKNLPNLVPTDVVTGRAHNIHMMTPGPDRWKKRSKTFQGIADAMAEQWSEYILARTGR